ncbi:MAG TPA: class I SAM-dependent methyltransferase [Planctomycetota bacterium]|nr:class I SAM-dependent methyltransferase [Planctomycetota bacterium]
MGLYTRTTRSWLERRFQRRSAAGVYLAHMPIYGLGQADAEGGHPARLARVLRMLRSLDGLEFTSLLDVGGAEGYLAHVVRTLFGARVITCDLSLQACLRAKELFGLTSAAIDCARLPFADACFDVVVCSEVLEHVEHPVETMLELQRVARDAVLLTTEEIRYDKAAIDEYLFRRPGWPHMERNLFHPDDLAAAFPGASMTPQCDAPPPRQLPDRGAARQWLLANTRSTVLEPGRIGVVVTAVHAGARTRPRRHSDVELIDHLLATTIAPGSRWPRASPPDTELLASLRDPATGGRLRLVDNCLLGDGGASYAVHDGVPDFVSELVRSPTRAELERRLAKEPGPRRAALLDLDARLSLPDRWPQDHFDLRDREQRRGFWPNHELVPRGSGEGFAWHATGNDPWVLTPCLQRPLREVVLELRVHNPAVAVDAGTGQIFWKGADDEAFEEARSVLFPLRNDGAVHEYRVVLAGHPRLPDEVQWLRLDLVDGPCEVDLLSLRLA